VKSGEPTSARRRSAGLGRGVSRDRRKVSGRAAAGGPGTAMDRSGPRDFRAARIAPHSHRLSLATKRPRGSGEAGPAGALAGRCEGATQPSGFLQHGRGRLSSSKARAEKETPPRREPGRVSEGHDRSIVQPPSPPRAAYGSFAENGTPKRERARRGGLFRCASRGPRGQSQTCSRRMTGLPQAS